MLSTSAIVQIAGTGLFVLAVTFLQHFLSAHWKKYTKVLDIPVVNLEDNDYKKAESEYIGDAPKLLRKGRTEFPGQPYQLFSPEGFITIIPERWIDELKNADRSVADNEALLAGVIGSYEWIQLGHPVIPHTVTKNLTPRLGTLIDGMVEELHYAIQQELPQSSDWSTVTLMPFVMRAISLMSGKIFVGTPLSRDPLWVECGVQFVIDLFQAGDRVRNYPYFVVAIGVKLGLFKEVEQVYRWQKRAREFIIPILDARRKARQADPDWTPPNDMLQYIMDAPHSEHKSLLEQADIQLVLAMSAIQATGNVATNFFYDLLARPEYIAPLRAEIEEVLAESDGKMSKKAFGKMVKLDSFIKESQRLSPSQHLTFDRMAMDSQGITFKNGFHMPKGTRFAVASNQIATDPANYINPDEFDGFRFANLRQASAEDALKYQFVTTNPINAMSFGHGKHACPGRFLASMMVKIVAVELLLSYDMRFPLSVTQRPKNELFGHNEKPDINVQVEMRRR